MRSEDPDEREMSIKQAAVGDVVKDGPTGFVVESDTVLKAACHTTEHRITAVPVEEQFIRSQGGK
jgi:hypothetical protein